MLGLEIPSVPQLCERLLQRGIIAIPEGNNSEVLGLTPPLTITQRQLDYCITELGRCIHEDL